MNSPRLSICIATRNRCDFIGATLESILCQITGEVEVIVLDGASTDRTQEVVESYQQRFPQLRYCRQTAAMGIDRDFAKAVELAHGEYCWLFCDDDLLKPGAIRVVLEAIRANYALILVNSEVRNSDLSKCLEPKRLVIDKNRIYLSSENDLLLEHTATYLTFIGGVIIQRQIWMCRAKDPYFGSCFIHVGIIFQQNLPGDALVIADPYVTIRYANASWLSKYFEIWMVKWPGVVWSFERFPACVKGRVYPKEPWRQLKSLLHFRAKGFYSNTEYTQFVRPRLKSRVARAASKAIAYVPGRIANLLAFLYYSHIRRPMNMLVLSDLEHSKFCFWKIRGRGGTRL